MIAGLSPPARRVIAIGLLVLVLLLALIALQMATAGLGAALDDLAQARARSARLEALRRRPEPAEAPPLPAGLAFLAPTHAAAAAKAAGRIGAAAAASELPPPSIAPSLQDATNPRLIRISFTVEGPESKILAFISQVERDPPVVRLRAWRISRAVGEAQALRLEATSVAAWDSPQ